MANLLGQNIGTNYKGILNLNTLNGNLSGTLQAVTDGDGNASPLQLSNTQVVYSGNTLNTLVFGAFNSTRTDGIGFFNSNSDSTPVWSLRAGNDCRVQMYSNEITFRAGGTNIVKLFPSSMGIGNPDAYTPSARLHVRGDGTNDISRFENTSANLVFRVGTGNAANPQATVGAAMNLYSRYLDGDIGTSSSVNGINAGYQSGHQNDWAVSSHYFTSTSRVFNNASVITGTAGNARFVQSFAIQNANSSAINYRSLAVEYTINNTVAVTGTATGIFLNATETALNGMTHNLMDLQVGGVSQFRVANNGNLLVNNTAFFAGVVWAFGSTDLRLGTNGFGTAITIASATGNTNFSGGRLQFGGTTNAFPALKRNGAALEVRLADDSGFAGLNTNSITAASTITGFSTANRFSTPNSVFSMYGNGQSLLRDTGSDENIASSLLAMNSTTRGFLPPRMTTTQKNAIASPAKGLIIFDDTLSKICVYNGSAWETVTSV